MIIREDKNQKYIIFDPENLKERTYLEGFPGLMKEGPHFFSPNKSLLIKNLFKRISKQHKDIKYTPLVKGIISSLEELLPLPKEFSFFTKPLKFQELALRFAYTYSNIGLLLEPGLGKTKVVLDFIWLKQFKLSVIIPPKALRYVWVEEAKKHRPELSVYVIETTDWEKELKNIIASKPRVLVVNYDKVTTLLEHLERLPIEFLGLDEGLIKNYKTDRTKAVTALSRGIPNRMIMSGTLINNSPLDVFSPVRFIEPTLVGNSVTKFKNRYAILNRRNKNIVMGFRDATEIRSILESCSIVMRKNEWLSELPKKVFHEVQVQLSDKQREYYSQLAGNYILLDKEIGLDLEIDSPLVMLTKLIQITNGFLYYNDPIEESTDECVQELLGEVTKKKAPKRNTYTFPDQPKADKLVEILLDEKRLLNKKAVIWFNMSEEKRILEKKLTEAGLTFITIAGGDKEISSKVARFNADANIGYLLCQAKSLNYGFTILGKQLEEDTSDEVFSFEPQVSNEIFYSLNFSLEVYLQQQDRIHRIGQAHECHYWVILTNTSIDKRIYKLLESKLSCNHQLMVDISKTAKLEE
jgi:SNF2 family DNA or RNA helicase